MSTACTIIVTFTVCTTLWTSKSPRNFSISLQDLLITTMFQCQGITESIMVDVYDYCPIYVLYDYCCRYGLYDFWVRAQVPGNYGVQQKAEALPHVLVSRQVDAMGGPDIRPFPICFTRPDILDYRYQH